MFQCFKLEQISTLFKTIYSDIRTYKFSLLPIVAALITFPILNFTAQYLLENAGPYFRFGGGDIYLNYSMKLRDSEQNAKPQVINLGGSGFRQAYNDDEGLSKGFDDKYNVFTAAYDGQTIIESFLIIKNSNIKKGDLVVLHSSISRLNQLYPHPQRICNPAIPSFFPSEVISTMIEANLNDFAISPLCHFQPISRWKRLSAFFSNILRDVLYKKAIEYRGYFPRAYDRDEKRLQQLREEKLSKQTRPGFIKRWLNFQQSNVFDSYRLISEIKDYVENRGGRLILLDPPQNIEWYRRYLPHMDEPYSKDYDSIISKFSELGLSYYDLRKLPQFEFEDFYDHHHLIWTGLKKLEPIYIDIVENEIGKTSE